MSGALMAPYKFYLKLWRSIRFLDLEYIYHLHPRLRKCWLRLLALFAVSLWVGSLLMQDRDAADHPAYWLFLFLFFCVATFLSLSLLNFVGYLIGMLLRWPWRIGASLVVRSIHRSLARDERPKVNQRVVLYLRPFAVDERVHSVDPKVSQHRAKRLANVYKLGWHDFIPFADLAIGYFRLLKANESGLYGGEALEKHIGRNMMRLGLPIAVRLPKAAIGLLPYPMLGGDWKKHVSWLMDKSDLILCIPYDSPGSRWEIEEIAKRGYLTKTIFLWPGTAMNWNEIDGASEADPSAIYSRVKTAIVSCKFPELDAKSGYTFRFKVDACGIVQCDISQPWKAETFGEYFCLWHLI